MGAPEPLLPDFGGGCLTGVVPALLGHLGAAGAGARAGAGTGSGAGLPSWVPAPVAEASQVVLMVVDGLGAQQLAARAALAPVLSSGVGGPITSVAPSTTACALTSLATGRVPAEHGIVGYRVACEGQIMNVLSWTVGGADARVRIPARVFQPCPTFPGSSAVVPVVTRYDYGPTGFTAAHLGEVELHPWHTPAGLVTGVRSLLAGGAPFVYAYYEGIDKIAHARGLDEYYEDELRSVDRLVGDVRSVLPPGAVLVVTADHGQVHVGGNVEVIEGELMEAVTLLSGEGRFRWLHVREGARDDVAAAAGEAYRDIAWVRTKTQIIDDGWLGGVPSAAVAARMGDVALIPFQPTAFMDPADTGELRLAARHGSLTPDEMLVPLLSWPAA
jgi:hypothetical protein